MSKREQLEKAIVAVEAQRASAGGAAVDVVLEGLRRELAELEAIESQIPSEADEPAPVSERRLVTVLICDVTGSTALAEKMDPETWAEIMDEAFEYLIEPIDRFGGTVAQLLGDGVLALFGVPTAHEDDPHRAVRAGLTILESIRPFRESLQRQRGLDFNVRVGINTGLVVTGRIGSTLHEGFTAQGDAINIATRMEATARPDTVQVSEHTCRLVASAFEFEETGAIEVEGTDAPVQAYRVLGRKAERRQVPGPVTFGLDSPFVGRDTEISAAKAALGRLLKGEGGILYIIGEAGIGKSRLVSELQKQSQDEALTWLTGRASPYGESISYRPFQEILRQHSGIREEDDEAETWRKLERTIGNLFPKATPEILPYLASLMSLGPPDEYSERVRYLDSEALRDQISVTSRGFFERLAQERPLVLVFEDLHRVDASSVRLLERVLPLVARSNLLICGVSRPEASPAAEQLRQTAAQEYAEQYTEISLSPLSRVDSGQLVRELLTDDDSSLRTRQLIVQKADGNPFFLAEIIRDLIEEGAIIQDAVTGRWRITSRVDTISIPDTIQGVILARIERFDEEVKQLLRAAAVIGRSFLLRILSVVLEADQTLDRHLAILQSAGLIGVKQELPEREYIFKHALTQEVTYQNTPLQIRRHIHAKVGQAIESLFADRLEEFYTLLAYHYAQAEAWEPAQAYLLKAGDQAGQVAADDEALTHYRRALEAYENAVGQNWDPLQRASLVRKMGEAYYGLGRLAESRNYFQNVLTLLDRPLPRSKPGLLAALVTQVGRQAAHRLWESRFVDRAPAAQRATLREVARTYERLGVIFYIEGAGASSIYAFLRSLNLAEPAGPSPELARAYANNVIAASLIPPVRFMADRYNLLALATANSGEDLAALAWVWQLSGIYGTGIGRWPAAIDAEEQAAEINKRIGRLRWWEESVATLAQALHIWGKFARSRELYLEVYRTCQARGDRQTQVWALAGQAETGLRLGDPGHVDEIVGCVEKAQALLTEYRYPNRPDEIQVVSLLAQIRLRRQEWELARQAAASVTELIGAEWPPSTFYTFEAYAGLPGIYIELWQAQMKGLYDATEPGTLNKLTGKACRSLHGFARVFPIAKPRAWLWQGTYHWMQNKPEKARKAWQKSLLQAERLDMLYDQGLAHYEIGRHLPEGDGVREDHLQRAVQIFSQLEAAWDLQRAELALRDQEPSGRTL